MMHIATDTEFGNHYLVQNIRRGLRDIVDDKTTLFYFSVLLSLLFLGLFGPKLAPYPHDEIIYVEGELLRNKPPSLAHPLGTNDIGQDVLSRVLYGARPTIISGLAIGSFVVGIGTTVGVIAGYVGGVVENVLMRFVDVVYGIPLIPFAIVLLALLGFGFKTSIIVLGLIMWRGNARVLRSQVLQIKERPYILAARATGASTPRIIFKHILPNISSMIILFFSIGLGYGILHQAGLAFIGVSNPFVPSWAIMIRNAYQSGQMAQMWWWSLPPGLLISLTVLSSFMFGRSFESDEDRSDMAVVEGA